MFYRRRDYGTERYDEMIREAETKQGFAQSPNDHRDQPEHWLEKGSRQLSALHGLLRAVTRWLNPNDQPLCK